MPAAAPAMVLLLLLAACSGAGDPVDGAGSSGTIQVVLFGDAEEVGGYRDLADAFSAANPDLAVTITPVATQDDLMARLTTSFAGGQPPDVFLLNFRRYGQFAAQGVIEEAQPYLDDSEVLDEGDISPTALDAFRFDGSTLTCVPQNLSSLVVYYNVDAFAAAGLPLPEAGWTWQQFLAAAQALTDPAADRYGLGMRPQLIRLAPFVWSAGGELVDDEEDPRQLTLGDGPAREALDWWLDLSLVHGVVPPDAQELSEDSESRFIRGRLGMYLNSRVAVPTLRQIDGFEWDVAPLPVAPGGQPASILHSDAYCMSAGTGREAQAWRFVEFAMGVEGQTILAESGRTVPSRTDVARSPVFLEPDLPPRSAQVFLDAEAHLRVTPRTGSWSRVEKEADSLLAEVYYGRVDREAGIDRLLDEVQALFAAAGS
ncbi:sugar ABC transporter substrate-binding protein [soil metagenome]